MARDISLDFGFDLMAKADPDNAGKPPMNYGFTVIGRRGNPVALSRRLRLGDPLWLTLYQLNTGFSFTGEVDEMSFQIRFRGAREGQTVESPTDGECFESFVISPRQGPVDSTVFEAGLVPSWALSLAGDGPAFPQNQLVSENLPVASVLTLRHEGVFYYTAELNVRWRDGEGQRRETHFRIDPEMVMGNDDPLPS